VILIRKSLGIIAASLLGAQAAHAVVCKVQTAVGTSYTVCRVDLQAEQLSLFWRDSSGQPYRQFSALRNALRADGRRLVFAVNAGMYQPDFSPVGLYIADGHQWVPLNRHIGSGNFSQQPNGVFLVEGRTARIITTSQYAEDLPSPTLATQSGPMLVHQGEITNSAVMSPNSSWRKVRNGVCAPSPEMAVFVISESPVTFYDFASFFRDSLRCREALYLDGSVSSLYAPDLGREDSGPEMGPILGVVTDRSTPGGT
jgi:uncharacterized protein YigE (DUF2233 family)